MTTIATLMVKLVADAAAFVSGLDQTEKRSQTWAAGVSKNLQDVGGKFTDFGGKATTFLTLPILGAGAAALTYASNLEETKNKVNVVFGEMTDDIMNWSKNSDQALGLSQQKALDAVGTFGAMGQAAGLSGTENIDWAKSLVQLSSDWSSFYNLNPVDSLNAIQSAVAGQYEPLRRMGIIINQSSLEQKAMQMGLMEEGGVLSDAARYQALYALMVDKSAAAQGDFARTADGVANQARIVKAQYENAAATLGQQLLPYATKLLGWVSQAITWFQALSPQQQKWIVGILAVTAVIGPLLVVIGTLISAIGGIVGVIGAVTAPMLIVIAVIAAIAAVIYLLYLAWTNNWGGIQQKTADVIAFIQNLIAMGMQFIEDLTSGKLGAVSTIWQNTIGFIQLYITNFVAFWKAIFAAFAAASEGDWVTFGAKMREAFDTLLKTVGALISTAWSNIGVAVKALIDKIIAFFKDTDWSELGASIIEGVVQGIINGIDMAVEAIMALGEAVLGAIIGFFGLSIPGNGLLPDLGDVGPRRGSGGRDPFSPAKATVPGIGNLSPRQASGTTDNGGVVIQNYGTIITKDLSKMNLKDWQFATRLT